MDALETLGLVPVWFNGELDGHVSSDTTVEDLTKAYHAELSSRGYDMSGDYKVLEVVRDDKGWTVWYE